MQNTQKKRERERERERMTFSAAITQITAYTVKKDLRVKTSTNA